MQTEVFKFGGSSFLDLDDYRRVAAYVRARLGAGRKIVLVVSAMAGMTERLRGVAGALNAGCSPEVSDGLLPLADTLSAALLSASLEGLGARARVLSAYQLGIITDANFSRARVVALDDGPIRAALADADVVVVPGGQAVSAQNRPTSLGKNSSDLSGVLLAAMLGLPQCEIYSDSCGIYSADPNLFAGVRLVESVSYDVARTLSLSGAKVLHHGAVREAQARGVRIVCRLNRAGYQVGTTILPSAPPAPFVVLDQRSVVLTIAGAAQRAAAAERWRAIGVPHVELGEAGLDALAVTCGFFDPVRDLAELGITALPQDALLCSVVRGENDVRRMLLPRADAVALAQALHDELYDAPPAASVSPLADDLLANLVSSR